MSEIERYHCHLMEGMARVPDGTYVRFTDHEADVKAKVEKAVAAERERFKPLIRALSEIDWKHVTIDTVRGSLACTYFAGSPTLINIHRALDAVKNVQEANP
jgi:hypothetical protein